MFVGIEIGRCQLDICVVHLLRKSKSLLDPESGHSPVQVIIFVIVASMTLLLSSNAAKAGLYGIFATQSNDLSLGIPIG